MFQTSWRNHKSGSVKKKIGRGNKSWNIWTSKSGARVIDADCDSMTSPRTVVTRCFLFLSSSCRTADRREKLLGSKERRRKFPSWAAEDFSIFYAMDGHCKERSTRSTNAGEAGGRTKKKKSSSRGGHRHSSKLPGVCCPFTNLAQNPRSWNLHNRQDIILTSSKTTGISRHQLPTRLGQFRAGQPKKPCFVK